MPVGRKNQRRIAHGHPADRHRRTRRKTGAQVHDCMHPDFCAAAELCAMKNGGASCDEHFFLDHRSDDMCPGSDKAVIADRAGMLCVRPNYGVFHHDHLTADPDLSAAFADDTSSVKNARARADSHIATHCCVRRDPSELIELWPLAAM